MLSPSETTVTSHLRLISHSLELQSRAAVDSKATELRLLDQQLVHTGDYEHSVGLG